MRTKKDYLSFLETDLKGDAWVLSSWQICCQQEYPVAMFQINLLNPRFLDFVMKLQDILNHCFVK